MTVLENKIKNTVFSYLNSPENRNKIKESITRSLEEVMAPLVEKGHITQDEVDNKIDETVENAVENMAESWDDLSTTISKAADPLEWSEEFKDILIEWSRPESSYDLLQLVREMFHG